MTHLSDLELVELANGRPCDDAAIRAHLDVCPECQARYQQLRSVYDALGTWRLPEATPDLWPKLEPQLDQPIRTPLHTFRPAALRLLRAAAVVLAGVGLGHGAARFGGSGGPVAPRGDEELVTALALHALERRSATGLAQIFAEPATAEALEGRP